MGLEFYLQSVLLGVGLAMDAMCVSMSNGCVEPKMKLTKILFISFMFGLFQTIMPLIGYLIGHELIKYIQKFIPWIALVLLSFLGIKMLIEAFKKNEELKENNFNLTFKIIFFQTIATSIDALSVGITIADYYFIKALVATSLIGIVTFLICILAHYIGKRFGIKFGNKAQILGGIILLSIGIEIFVKGIFF